MSRTAIPLLALYDNVSKQNPCNRSVLQRLKQIPLLFLHYNVSHTLYWYHTTISQTKPFTSSALHCVKTNPFTGSVPQCLKQHPFTISVLQGLKQIHLRVLYYTVSKKHASLVLYYTVSNNNPFTSSVLQ